MRYLTLAALVLAATPAFSQTAVAPSAPAPAVPAPPPVIGGSVAAPVTMAPVATTTPASTVPCACGPAPVRSAAVRRVRVRRRTYYGSGYGSGYASRAPAPLYPLPAVGFESTAIAPAPTGPSATLPVTSGGILGPVSTNEESIAFLGLGYTDGYIGAEAGAGGSGPLHAGY